MDDKFGPPEFRAWFMEWQERSAREMMALSYDEFVKRTPYASIGRETVDTDRIGRLLRASGFQEVVTVHGPARVGKTAELVHQLQMASVYDHAYWEARLHSAVLSAMMNVYIDTGEVVVVAPAPTGEMAVSYFDDPNSYIRSYQGQPGETVTITMLVSAMEKPPVERAQPDYLRHDPTKQVGKRRQRKAYGRKGDRR